jgi:hypothetical protein
MKKLSSFVDIVDLWESYPAMAVDLGLERRPGSEVVRKWRERSHIDSRWWVAILKTAKAREVGLTADLLAKIASRRYADSP